MESVSDWPVLRIWCTSAMVFWTAGPLVASSAAKKIDGWGQNLAIAIAQKTNRRIDPRSPRGHRTVYDYAFSVGGLGSLR